MLQDALLQESDSPSKSQVLRHRPTYLHDSASIPLVEHWASLNGTCILTPHLLKFFPVLC